MMKHAVVVTNREDSSLSAAGGAARVENETFSTDHTTQVHSLSTTDPPPVNPRPRGQEKILDTAQSEGEGASVSDPSCCSSSSSNLHGCALDTATTTTTTTTIPSGNDKTSEIITTDVSADNHDTTSSILVAASSSASQLPPASLPGSPAQRGAASSEEDSVAEMDYMSESSNISLKDVPLLPPPPIQSSDSVVATNSEENNLATTTSFGLNSKQQQRERLVVLQEEEEEGRRPSPSRTRTSTNATAASTTIYRTPSGKFASFAPPPTTRSSSSNFSPMAAARSSSITTSSTGRNDDGPGRLLVGAAVRASTLSSQPQQQQPQQPDDDECLKHRPLCLPKFEDPISCVWTASHAANLPSEDRSASLVNVILQPLPPNFDSETQLPDLEEDFSTLIRINLWSVIDGHGGGCVATYASEVLLPHIAASIARALGCAIIDRGVCTVNGQLRDANALDLDGLITTSDQGRCKNPNSIHYRSPFERSDSEEECDGEIDDPAVPGTAGERKQLASLVGTGGSSVDGSIADGSVVMTTPKTTDRKNKRGVLGPGAFLADSLPESGAGADASVSSVKTSVKTAASLANRDAPVGTHSPREVAAITRAITESFLAVDEGWINSIDPVATHQNSCQSNGRWNSGACALVVFTIQRLDWTNVSEPGREKELRGPEETRRYTSQNRDAARRRMLDYAARAKSVSSMSTVSSTSSLTTEEAVNASGLESEITETEGDDDDRSVENSIRKRNPSRSTIGAAHRKQDSLISAPGGCSCHCYRAHDAILYTAHVGDCRAVMLGSAPPRTIKVRDTSHADTTDDESSHHSSDETECLSSSDHDADSSEGEDIEQEATTTTSASGTASSYMNFPRRVVRQTSVRRRHIDDISGPYTALPPLYRSDESKVKQFNFETDISHRERRIRSNSGRDPSDSSASSQDSNEELHLIHLPPVTRPIDLTTDHSAYNPAEVTAVLRRCNNAPRAISAGVGGGIKRVAGSLAVTRALGDAYLKTPLLSFLPYKSHAPYITARPEVNCRPLVKDGDKVLILATDGVWERASGEDCLRWVRNFFEERVAEAERRSNRRLNQADKSTSNDESDASMNFSPQEVKESDLFLQNEVGPPPSRRKRELGSSPSPVPKRRKRGRQNRITYNVADVIVRRVLNKVRRARNISSLQALMSLPQGRARRSKHDDITASVVDLSAFVS